MLSIIVVVLILAVLFVQITKNVLIYKKFPTQPTGHLADLYTPDSYAKSRFQYKNLAIMHIVKHATKALALIICILFGLFNRLDLWVRAEYGKEHYIVYGVIFLAVYYGCEALFEWPFRAWDRIIKSYIGNKEMNPFERYSFNIGDSAGQVASTFVASCILAPFVIYGITTINTGFIIQLCLMIAIMIAILPELANRLYIPYKFKLAPCTEEEIISAANKITSELGYKKTALIQVLKTSTEQANALVAGRKNKMRIVLDPKLIAEYPQNEIQAVLAHEFGHVHHRHFIKGALMMFVVTMISGAILMAVVYNPDLAHSFGMQHASTHASMLIALLLIEPMMLLATAVSNWYGQKKEKQADVFAVHLTKDTQSLVSAFQRMHKTNVEHPNVHWLPLLLDHSHPPLAVRIKYLLEEEKTIP